jgi:hypothetical protein
MLLLHVLNKYYLDWNSGLQSSSLRRSYPSSTRTRHVISSCSLDKWSLLWKPDGTCTYADRLCMLYTARCSTQLPFCSAPLKPSGHCTYRQFNTQQFYVLPTQCVYVFCVDLRTNSDYFPIQH